MPDVDDVPTSQPGGTPSEPPEQAGPPEQPGHPLTAHDAYPFVQKVIG